MNVLEGHTGSVEGASLFSDGRILSWSEDRSLRVWDATTGACLSVLVGHTDSVKGAWLLSDRRILSWSDAESWSRDQTLRLWNAATGECLALLKESDAASRHPEWLHARTKTERPDAVALEFFATTLERTADLRHKSVSGSVAAWQAESKFNAECLRTDGTLVVTQANGQVCFLKLYYGNRRVSLPEAEDILRSTGQVPQSGLADM